MKNGLQDEISATLDVRAMVDDRPEEGVFRIDRRTFTDPAIFEMELDRVFARNWVFLAHESQLKKPGDILTTHIGRVPVLVTRNKAGILRGMINSCAHRGALLARAQRANQSVLSCSYHGWCYDLDGVNVFVKDREAGGYPKAFDQCDRNLTPLARFESYRGFVFGSLGANVEPLEDHLGDVRTFLDLVVDQSEHGLEVLRGSSTYTYAGNWKLQAENGVDGYHFTTVHANYVRLVMRRAETGNDKVKAIDGRTLLQQASGCYDLGNGHNLIWADLPNAPDRPVWEKRDEILRRVGETRTRWMTQRMRNLLIYPNVQVMDQASSQIRVFRPLSANETEVKIYCIAPVGESAAARERRIRQYEDFFNASGMATPDDLAQFEACQDGYADHDGRRWVGYERGQTHMTAGADAEAASLGIRPFSSGANIQDETLFQGQYRRWLKLMTGVAQEAELGKRSAGAQHATDLSGGRASRSKEVAGVA